LRSGRTSVALPGRLGGRGQGDAGGGEPAQGVPSVRDPARVNGDVSVARVLPHGAALAARTLAPNTAVRRVVAERPPVPRLEAFLREERGLRRTGPRHEVDLAFFAGLEQAERHVLIRADVEPVGGKEPRRGHASSLSEAARGERPRGP